MTESFEFYWRKWETENERLWEEGTNFGVSSDNKSMTNVEALINCVLRPKTPLYFRGKKDADLIDIIREFNKRLGKNNGTFEDNFSNNNLKGAVSEAKNIKINKIIVKQKDNSDRSITNKESIAKLSNNKIISNDNKVNTDGLLQIIKERLENRGQTFEDNVSISNVKLSMKGTLTVTLSTKSKMDDFSLFASEDKLKILWYTTYLPIINDSLGPTMNKLGGKAGKQIQESIDPSKEIKTIDFTEELLTKQAKMVKTLEWITNKGIQEKIKKILNEVAFYKNNNDRQNAFIGFFKDQIQKKSINYFTITGEYPEAFGGDFGEVDSLVRTALAMGKSRSRNSNQYGKINIEILGKETTEHKKQVPADGRISFNYNGKNYTCTFQSKNYSLSTLQRALYAKDNFRLVPAESSDEVNQNINKTNLYSYDIKTLNIGYQMLKAHNNTDKEKTNQMGLSFDNLNNLKNGANYIGAVPGLARIKTYVGDDITGKSDFYYFSGYFIPSFLFLRLIKQRTEEQKNKALVNITVTTRKDSLTITELKGNLNKNSNPYDILKRF